MVLRPLPNFTAVKSVSEKALFPMEITLSGMEISVRPVEENARLPISWTVSGITREVRLLS